MLLMTTMNDNYKELVLYGLQAYIYTYIAIAISPYEFITPYKGCAAEDKAGCVIGVEQIKCIRNKTAWGQ